MSGSTAVLTTYYGNGSSSIVLATMCVVIGIVGATWFIYSCATRRTTIDATLGGLSGFTFFVACTLGYGVLCWSCLVGYQCDKVALTCFGPAGISCVPLQRPLCLSVDCSFVSFGIMLIIYSILCYAV